jgi:hypothetical protein
MLESGRVEVLRSLWSHVFPGLPQPESREQAEIVMHRARTEAESVSLKARAYSHAWLCERGLPSGLPDDLKPKAERIYPVVVSAVGVSINARSPLLQPAAKMVERVVCDAVEDLYADGRTDPTFVRSRILEVKDREFRALFGRLHA